MSNRIFQAVWDNGPLARSEMIVLMVLADCADAETGTCFPSKRHIAHHARMSEKTVQRTLRALEAEGWILIRPKLRPDGSTGSNIYQIVFEALGLETFVRRRTARLKEGGQNVPPPGQNVPPPQGKMSPYVGGQNVPPITNHKEQNAREVDSFDQWLALPFPKPQFKEWSGHNG